jgi:hypothetical protein
MCGITGWVDFERDLRAERATLKAMTATMACRGPDDEGVWCSAHAAIGHIGARHATVTLTADDLITAQWAPLAAHDLPGFGDMGISLYLAVKRMRCRSHEGEDRLE